MSLSRFMDMRFLGISVLLHMSVLTFFVFRFQPEFQSLKPGFVFLGPILKQEETNMTENKRNPMPFTQTAAIPWQLIPTSKPYPSSAVTKPGAEREILLPQREWLKSTFELAPAHKKTLSPKSTNDLGVDLETPVYVPLRFRHAVY